MIRGLSSLIFLLFSLSSFSQDWHLFPLHQKSYYRTDGFSQKIIAYHLDTAIHTGTDIIYIEANGTEDYCDIDTIANWSQLDVFDSIRINDSFHLLPEKFYHTADTGFSWIIPFYNSSFNKLKITCDSISFDSLFFGQQDSLKFFSFQAYNNSSSISHPINTRKLILSKHFGMMEGLVFFKREFNHSINFAELIGFQNDSIQFGFLAPQVDDYLLYQVGDILKWKAVRQNYPPIFNPERRYWMRDSIIAISNTPDTYKYSYNRHIKTQYNDSTGIVEFTQWHYNQEEMINKKEISHLISGPTGGRVSSEPMIFQHYSMDPNKLYFDKSHYDIDSTDLTNITFNASCDYIFLDVQNCEIGHIYDVGFNFTLNTIAGFTYKSESNFSTYYEQLIGYDLSASGTWGDVFPIGIEENSPAQNLLKIFPNPAEDHITLEYPNEKELQFNITNIYGSNILAGNISSGDELDISGFPAGIYFITIMEGEKLLGINKLLKN